MQARHRSVLFLAPEPVTTSATGPARRTLKLAEAVAERCVVTLAAPGPSVFPDGPFRTLETNPSDGRRLARAMSEHDVTVVQVLPSPRRLFTARRHARRLVADLIAPLALELAEMGDHVSGTRAEVRWRTRQMVAHLAVADLVLCTNERQRDLLVGAALSAGVLDPGGRPPLHGRLVVVPHGLDEPQLGQAGRSRLHDNGFAGDGDRIAVWGGGIWKWLDPLTAIKAIERLRASRPDVKLAFVGFEHPDQETRRAHESVAKEAMAYVRDRGLEREITFLPRWLSREDFVAHLRDADVGISLNGSTLESRYATRTRVLDYLAASLPVICTRGDAMSHVVESHGLGRVVDPGDIDGTADALDRLTAAEPQPLADPAALAPLRWPSVAQPLVEFCAGEAPDDRQARGGLAMLVRSYPDFVRAVYRTEGPLGLARAAARRVADVANRD
jgi:glycosyltransferase involved in cell wall biosynthesis